MIPQLARSGRYVRPSLGIEVDEQVNARLNERTGAKGVFVLAVQSGSPAAAAGLSGMATGPQGVTPGDIITAVEGREVPTVGALLSRLDDFKVGDVVTLTVMKQEQERQVRVELGADGSAS
ncbi:S1C family serine protease [Novosphingobium panipatense]